MINTYTFFVPHSRRFLSGTSLVFAVLLSACAPEGPSGGPHPAWFRGPGPEEYLGALEYRRSSFDRTTGLVADSSGTSSWTAWALDARVLILEETFSERDSLGHTERGTRETFFWGPGAVAALRETRLRPRVDTQDSTAISSDPRPDTLVLDVAFEADTVWSATLFINGRDTVPDSAIVRAVGRARARRAAISAPPAQDST